MRSFLTLSLVFTLVLASFSCANKKENSLVFDELKVLVCHLTEKYDLLQPHDPIVFQVERVGEMSPENPLVIGNHRLNVFLHLGQEIDLKDAFIDIHKVGETHTHEQNGHQDGVHHDMPDGFQGRIVLNREPENKNGTFTYKNQSLVLENRQFPQLDQTKNEYCQTADCGAKAVGIYKIVIGATDPKNYYKEYIFFFEIVN